uniref:Large ribosomal subunit protein uL13 n=1 Tax=Schlesneria paludicola TaxID=360056 RepID=A0A7C2K066_9PLAN
MKSADVAVAGAAAPQWFVIDAENQVVGRLATQIATVLMGKHKPSYTPHVDSGDYVVVVNADKVKFVGNEMVHPRHKYYTDKMAEKRYFRHSMFPGGLKEIPAVNLWDKCPTEILRLAVKRMLPKNALARHKLEDKLKLYAGPDHPHQAQQPQAFPEHLLP